MTKIDWRCLPRKGSSACSTFDGASSAVSDDKVNGHLRAVFIAKQAVTYNERAYETAPVSRLDLHGTLVPRVDPICVQYEVSERKEWATSE